MQKATTIFLRIFGWCFWEGTKSTRSVSTDQCKLATDKKGLEYGRIRLDCLLVQSRRKEQRCFAKEKPPSLRSYAPCDDELKLEKLRKFTAIFAICAVLRTPVSYSARSSSRSRQPRPVTTSACCSATEIWMDRTPGPQGYR
jgi:hypothetical protein